jgi:hypothetical protein
MHTTLTHQMVHINIWGQASSTLGDLDLAYIQSSRIRLAKIPCMERKSSPIALKDGLFHFLHVASKGIRYPNGHL